MAEIGLELRVSFLCYDISSLPNFSWFNFTLQKSSVTDLRMAKLDDWGLTVDYDGGGYYF